ncbi:MAG: lspA [Clostridiales bacterium]|nr:lspA [Clostridiales bacterium]
MIKKLWYAVWLVLLIVFDQITKLIAIDKLKDSSPFPIIKNVFDLTYLENRGAAFGMFQGKFIVLSIISIIVLGTIGYIFFKIPNEKKYRILRFTLVLLSAGAIGNLIDRIYRGFVVDFFYFIPINFPVFNVADIYVTCSAAILIILLLFVYKDEDILKSNK